jgi:glycosyltransferase involved in cell wall biosynthesis
MSQPLVSISVPTLNSEKMIGNCLESIRRQTYPNIETIVVDGFSKDRTVEIARKYTPHVYEFGPSQSKERVFGGPYQRNYGASKATGEFVYYVDSDMELPPTVIESCVKACQEHGYDALNIYEESFGIGFWAKCKWLERACYVGEPLIAGPRFVRKKVWDALGGLDAKLGGGDDWDFHDRLIEGGYKIGSVPELVRHNEGHLKLWPLCRKRYVYGKTVRQYFKKHQDTGRNFSKFTLFRSCFFRNWRLFVKHPVVGAGVVVMRTAEYSAAALGILKSFLAPSKIELEGRDPQKVAKEAKPN